MDIKELEDLVRNGYISKVRHPVFDLRILNYTKKTSKEAIWNELTLNSRGLILDSNYKVISRPFRKFFEYEQLKKEFIPKNNQPHKIYQKLDGTLGILYWKNDLPFISTRGVFDSYQALIANDILYKKYKDCFNWFNRDYTYLFEIISPKTRNVINYQETEDIFLIGCVNIESGKELNIFMLKDCPFPRPKKVDAKLDCAFKSDFKNQEGYVVIYENNFKIKIKFSSYRKKHLLYASYKTKVLSYLLNNKTVIDFLDENVVHSSDKEYIRYLFAQGLKLKTCLLFIVDNKDKFLPIRVSNKLKKINQTTVFSQQFLSSQFFSMDYEIFDFTNLNQE